MAFLLYLPPELLKLIFSFLPRQSLSLLSSTCHTAYDICLPSLYAHVHLGLRAHVRQLEEGLRRRPKLKETMQECTRRLTMTNQQNCNMWVVRDFAWLFGVVRNVRQLTLVHFDGLSVGYLSRLAQQLPAVEHLYIQYSQLRSPEDNNMNNHYYYHQHYQQSSSSYLTFPPKHPSYSAAAFSKATHLQLCWTDFSEAAITDLFRLLPNIEQVNLGANRNKVRGANTAAVKAIAEHCKFVKDLTISLQQVSEPVLCDTIGYYGPQLHSLSIRCDGRDTLCCVARHATQVKNLTIRAGSIPPPSSSSSQTPQQQQQQANVVLTLPDNRQVNDQQIATAMTAAAAAARGESTTEGNVLEYGSIVGILQRCPLLVHLEMVSWLVEDVPREVWRGLEAVALRRRAPHLLLQRSPQQESKTLALGMEELQEIRNQIMAKAPPSFTPQNHQLASLSAPSLPVTSR